MEQNIIFAVTVIVFALVGGSVGIATYILGALGLYRLAKNRGIKKPWLAWIPMGDCYIMGRLSEHSPYVGRKFPKMHIILPVLFGADMILILCPLLFFNFYTPSGPGTIGILIFFVFAILSFLYASFVLVAIYFVLYHIFKVYDPQNAVLFTILSAFGLSSIFIFVIRNKAPALKEQ